MELWKQELYHHGILGMKWGRRNGPPYPLAVNRHSEAEKRAGWRKSLASGGRSGGSAKKKRLSDKQKRAIKIAGLTAAGVLAVYGAYKYKEVTSSAKPAIEIGMNFVSNYDLKPQEFSVESIKIDPLKRLEKEGIKTLNSVTENGQKLKDLEFDNISKLEKEIKFDEIEKYTKELLDTNNKRIEEAMKNMGY